MSKEEVQPELRFMNLHKGVLIFLREFLNNKKSTNNDKGEERSKGWSEEKTISTTFHHQIRTVFVGTRLMCAEILVGPLPLRLFLPTTCELP
jgi:hypothetical protein